MARTQDLVAIGFKPKDAQFLGDGSLNAMSFEGIGGAYDDAATIQLAIDFAVSRGLGAITIPADRIYTARSTIEIPITARDLSIFGYGAQINGAVDGDIFHLSDTTTADNAARNIKIAGLYIAGAGYTDTTYPNQNGMRIDAILGFKLEDVRIENIPNTGIIGTKSTVSGSTYWNKVIFDNVKVRFCGYQGYNIGTGDAVDDLTIQNSCIVNHCGEKVTSNLANGSSFIKAISLNSSGLEVSGNYSISNAGFGYRWGLMVKAAGGSLDNTHYEINCNNQAGSSDLLLDSDCHGLLVQGSDHYGNSANAAKFCIQSYASDNYFTGIKWSGDGTHVYDYVLELGSATRAKWGTIYNNGSVPIGVALVNGLKHRKGTTAERPTLDDAYIGQMFMDTTLHANGLPVWWNGANWIQYDGTAV